MSSLKKEFFPKYRFSGFTENWSALKLKEIVTPVKREIDKPKTAYYRLSIRSHAKGTFKQLVSDPSSVAMKKLFVVHNNDLIVNITFAWEHAVAVAKEKDHGLLVSHRFPTYTITGADRNFLEYLIRSPKFKYKLGVISPGGAGRNRVLNQKDFLKIKEVLPESSKEQTKIGELFQKLDRAIELQQQKVEQSERYKKAMLQKMFPQKGETEPQLRFEGFSGGWECQRLDELVLFSKGKGYSKSDLCESGVEIILYGSLYTNYQTTISKVHTFAEDKGNSVYSEGVEVLLPSSGETSVDIARASAVLKKGIILGGDLNILKPKREYNSTFLALNLTYSSANRELIKRAQGQVVVHLYNSDIAGVKLMLPTLEEQTKIGEFFQSLDARIEVETKKLNHYESLKKAMLQRMFV